MGFRIWEKNGSNMIRSYSVPWIDEYSRMAGNGVRHVPKESNNRCWILTGLARQSQRCNCRWRMRASSADSRSYCNCLRQWRPSRAGRTAGAAPAPRSSAMRSCWSWSSPCSWHWCLRPAVRHCHCDYYCCHSSGECRPRSSLESPKSSGYSAAVTARRPVKVTQNKCVNKVLLWNQGGTNFSRNNAESTNKNQNKQGENVFTVLCCLCIE